MRKRQPIIYQYSKDEEKQMKNTHNSFVFVFFYIFIFNTTFCLKIKYTCIQTKIIDKKSLIINVCLSTRTIKTNHTT